MRASALLAVLLAIPAAADSGLKAFPRADELFPKLIAAPKQFQLGVSGYGLLGRTYSDVSLGHAWGLVRGRAGDQMTQWQLDGKAMSFSRWSEGRLEAVDLMGEIPLTVRRGDVSGSAALFYESAHLGDDHIRRTSRRAMRTTQTGLRVLAALEPWDWARAYAGPSFLFDTAPTGKRWGWQWGAELMSRDLGLFSDFPIRAYVAEDVQHHERVGFNPNAKFSVGAKIGYKDSPKSVRVQAGYFAGHSYYGQFQGDREHFADLSVILEL